MSSFPLQPTRREVAFHEAGHIFCGIILGKGFLWAEIHPEKLIGKGETRWQEGESNTLIEGTVAAAGFVAEEISKGNDPPLVFPLSLYGAESTDAKLARDAAKAQVESGKSSTTSEEEQMAQYLKNALMTCTVQGWWPAIEDIANELDILGSIDSSKAEAIFKHHNIPTGTLS